jgi:hypothetical protein
MAGFQTHGNLAVSTVATAPSPATSGTSLVVAAGTGTRFPSPNAQGFSASVWPAGANPTPANAEIVNVSAISTDTFTIARAQEGTTARAIVVGDQIALTVTAKHFTDIETRLTNVWTDGTGAPSGGDDGDYYLDNDTGDVYHKASGSWTVVANIIGPDGPNGPQGVPGDPGTNGAIWYDGSGAPSSGLGVDGDYYLNSDTGDPGIGDVYNKISGSWVLVSNIKGVDGSNGPQGPQGDPGVVAATSPVLYDSGTQTVSLDIVPSTLGGTGVNNASTITLGGALVTSGANALTLTTTGVTNVTLPTTGTLLTTTGNGSGLTSLTAANISAGTAGISVSGSAGSVANALSPGTHLSYASGSTFDGSAARTLNTDAASANTASTIVARDSSGNFTAGTITAALTGNASTATNVGFSGVTTGTSAVALHIGTGGTLDATGSGTITATSVPASGLTGATLASGVTGSSLTSLGTVGTGVWQASIIGSAYGGTGNGFTKFSGATATEKTYTLPDASTTILTTNAVVTAAQGGTGVANSNTITLAGNLVTSGANSLTLTTTGSTNVTLPTSGTLATTAAIPSAANPTATIGTSAVNGSASTFMRSDGAPAMGNLTGNVTSTGLVTTIASGVVTNAMLAGSIDLTTKVTGALPVANGGTSLATLTAHSLYVGNGTSAPTALGSATNGQLVIGSTGADPALATITAGTGIVVTNSAGGVSLAAAPGSIADTDVLCGTSTTGTGPFTLAALPAAIGAIDPYAWATATGLNFVNGNTLLVEGQIIEFTDSTFTKPKFIAEGVLTLTLGASLTASTITATTVQSVPNPNSNTYTVPGSMFTVGTAANVLILLKGNSFSSPHFLPYFETSGDNLGAGPAGAFNSSAGALAMTSGSDYYIPFEWRVPMLVKKLSVRVRTAYSGSTGSPVSTLYGRIYAMTTGARPGRLLIDFGTFGTNPLNTGSTNISTSVHASGYFLPAGEYFMDLIMAFSGATGTVVTPVLQGMSQVGSLLNSGRFGAASFAFNTHAVASSGTSGSAPNPANVTSYAGNFALVLPAFVMAPS